MAQEQQKLKEKIQQQLFWDARLDSSAISIETVDGKVRLSGTVPSYWARQIAEYDTRAVKGVNDVENELSVMLPSGKDVPQDATIQSSVSSLLAFDQRVDDSDIEVRVENGEVMLDGTVPSLWQKEKAEEIALNIDGVTLLINRLAVVPTRFYVDELIARDIEAALDRHADVNVNNVDVQVSEGNVVISGTVPHFSAFKTAQDIAKYTDGVISVKNNLIIEAP
ncbi:BON domain-containing protein [Chitinispirillales bacterium ANBcel5]|uniref:BON domain-containing protein n=1 Tax=Cellulosispirillum alkaliphilum TaxID=3039283 RepID=UPI002A4E7D19|nr:BON domain-containing protein [Chitinispirillales bacterium ANBcel5]